MTVKELCSEIIPLVNVLPGHIPRFSSCPGTILRLQLSLLFINMNKQLIIMKQDSHGDILFGQFVM
jgi:hypothetical protein